MVEKQRDMILEAGPEDDSGLDSHWRDSWVHDWRTPFINEPDSDRGATSDIPTAPQEPNQDGQGLAPVQLVAAVVGEIACGFFGLHSFPSFCLQSTRAAAVGGPPRFVWRLGQSLRSGRQSGRRADQNRQRRLSG